MFANHLPWITGNYPKYIRNSYNSVAKNPNNLVFKWAKDQNGKFYFSYISITKEDLQIANKYV